MVRSGMIGGGLFIFAGLIWALYDPLLAYREVQGLAGPNILECEAQLMRRGDGARWALRKGSVSENTIVRLRSARLLALLGDDDADSVLITFLSKSKDQRLTNLAEHLLLTIWNRRKGPSRDIRTQILNQNPGQLSTDQDLEILDSLLSSIHHQKWSGGYVMRGNILLQRNENSRAQADAVTALRLDPCHFDAMILLGRCLLLEGLPDHALTWFERAAMINPKVQEYIQEEWDNAKAAIRLHEKRERRARRRMKPLV